MNRARAISPAGIRNAALYPYSSRTHGKRAIEIVAPKLTEK
jgi:hypothetical protein